MPTLPCIGIARTAGLKLREMSKKGPVRVWFRAHVENGWRPVQITIGEIRRRPPPRGRFRAGRRASGLLARPGGDRQRRRQRLHDGAGARVHPAPRQAAARPRRSASGPAHETGTMVGSAWFVDRNWDRLREHCVAYLQIDQPACAGTTRWSAASNAELKRFHQAHRDSASGSRTFKWRRAVKNGDSQLLRARRADVAGAGRVHRGGAEDDGARQPRLVAPLHREHASTSSTSTLCRTTCASTRGYLWELCTAPVLPFAFVPVADSSSSGSTSSRRRASAIGLDGARSRAEQFAEAAARLDSRGSGWRGAATRRDAARTTSRRCC